MWLFGPLLLRFCDVWLVSHTCLGVTDGVVTVIAAGGVRADTVGDVVDAIIVSAGVSAAGVAATKAAAIDGIAVTLIFAWLFL